MVQADFLTARVFRRCAPDHCYSSAGVLELLSRLTVSELLHNLLVNSITEILHCALSPPQHNWRAIIGLLSSRLCVAVHQHQPSSHIDTKHILTRLSFSHMTSSSSSTLSQSFEDIGTESGICDETNPVSKMTSIYLVQQV